METNDEALHPLWLSDYPPHLRFRHLQQDIQEKERGRMIVMPSTVELRMGGHSRCTAYLGKDGCGNSITDIFNENKR
jgi:hypothetical protein